MLRTLALVAAGLAALGGMVLGAGLLAPPPLTRASAPPPDFVISAPLPQALPEPEPRRTAAGALRPPASSASSEAVAAAVPLPPSGAAGPVAMLRPPPLREPGSGADDAPKIALIIDDLGLSSARAERVIALPGPITLAFLPYGSHVAKLAAAATAAGHELLLHLPMEPEDGALDPGPNALEVGLGESELERRIAWNLSRFSGYVGVNNHMGSRFTRSAPDMRALMAVLKRRDLLFVDSVTTNQTVGVTVAREQGVATVGRDVFLDTEQAPQAVADQLRQVEEAARRHGHVVAIGHPYPVTLEALERWLPSLRAKGLRLVPVSAVASAGAQG